MRLIPLHARFGAEVHGLITFITVKAAR